MTIKECSIPDIIVHLNRLSTQDDFEYSNIIAEAIALGFEPNVDKAIDRYFTVCSELDVGKGYAEHLIGEHPYKEVVEALSPIFADQAENFLCEQE